MEREVWLRVLLTGIPLVFLSPLAVLGQNEASESPPPLFTLDVDADEVPLEFGRTVVDAEAEFLIDLDQTALANDPVVLTLGLYKGVRLEAHRFMSRAYPAPEVGAVVGEWTSWTGQLYLPDVFGPASPIGVVMLNDHGNHITGVIQVDVTQEDFQILGNSKGEHRLIRMAHERHRSCALQVDPSTGGTVVSPAMRSASPEGTETDVKQLELSGDVEIRVLALIPDASGGAVSFIQDSISIANNLWAYSAISNVSYVLAGAYIGNIGIPDQDNVFDYIDWMNNEGRSTIEFYRNIAYVKADMVALFVQPIPGQPYCGIANLRFRNGEVDTIYDGTLPFQNWDSDQPAYSVHVIGCGLSDYTFAHELGHNFGLRHDVTDSGESPNNWGGITPIDEDPRGHEFMTWMGPRATVMGCWGEFAPCERTHYYSDPNIYWYGWCPTGNTDHPYNANAAGALRNRVVEYSLLR